MKDPYLLLWLEGPLQSWGHDSRFGRRDSLAFPTKSGILGLVCCARGAAGEQTEWLSAWGDLDMQTIAFVPASDDGEALPRQPLMRDFQMVGSGYDERDSWASLLIPKTSEGKRAVGGGTKLTYRYYLQDMAYAVALQGPDALIQEASDALSNPVWDLFLGRKNCAPTEFIGQGIHESSDQALETGKQMAREKNRSESFRVIQGEHEGELLTLNDVPVRFGTHKKYRDRRVTVQLTR